MPINCPQVDKPILCDTVHFPKSLQCKTAHLSIWKADRTAKAAQDFITALHSRVSIYTLRPYLPLAPIKSMLSDTCKNIAIVLLGTLTTE